MGALRQTSFATGELAPAFWGRSDFKLWGAGVKKALNWFINPQGSLMTRPGTRYITNGFFSAASGRLFPYVYSDSSAFVIAADVFGGVTAISFNKTTGVVTTTAIAGPPGLGGGGMDYSEIQYAQVGAVLIFTHPLMPGGPKQLVYDGATWTLGSLDFTYPTLVWRSIPLGNQDTGAPFIVENIAGTFTAPWLPGATAAVNTAPFTATATEPLVDWVYAVSAVIKDSATGALIETRPYVIINKANGVGGAVAPFAANARIAVSATKPVYIMRYAPAGGVVSAPNIVTYNYYKGRAGVFGFIGASTDLQFVDDGRQPDYQRQPLRPTAVSPWLIDGVSATDYPSAVAHFENRRVFGGGSKRPATIIASEAGDFFNFDDYPLAWHGGPLSFNLASLKRERMRALVGHSQLLAFTDTSVFAISGAAGAPLDYDTLSARLIDQVGSRSVQPLVAGGHVLYARSKGAGARMLTADFSAPSGGYKVADVTQHALHLFAGNYVDPATSRTRQLKWWAYAEDPFGLIWATRADGTLLLGTPFGESIAWTKCQPAPRLLVGGGTSAGDAFYSVCSIPEGDEDAVYVSVARQNGGPGLTRTIERFESRVIHDNNDDVACLDCAVKGNCNTDITTFGSTITVAILANCPVYFVARGNPVYGPYLADSSGIIDLINPLPGGLAMSEGVPLVANNAGTVDYFIGLGFQCDVETLDFVTTETRQRQRTLVKAGIEVDSPIGVQVGPDASHLEECLKGYSLKPYNAGASDLVVAYSTVKGTLDTKGSAYIRQSLPLPVTLLGITREVDVGG